MYVNCRDCLDPLVPWGPQALTADGGTLVSRALKERKETMAEEALWVQKEVWWVSLSCSLLLLLCKILKQ